MNTEKWKQIVGFEDYYEISSHGRVKSRGQFINGWSDGKYMRVTLSVNGEETTFKIHRLVATHFKANPDCKAYVNHIDCNTFNNYEDNLEWNTPSENVFHAYKNNRIKRHRGVNSHMSKVLLHTETGVFATVSEVANMESKSFGQMAAIIRGEYPNKTKWILT